METNVTEAKTVDFSNVLKRFPSAKQANWHNHANGGGWVENTATVAETAFVGPDAIIAEQAFVLENAEVKGTVLVSGAATIQRKAKVDGNSINSIITNTAMVTGNAFVAGSFKLFDCLISDNARVLGDVEISNDAKISGAVIIDSLRPKKPTNPITDSTNKAQFRHSRTGIKIVGEVEISGNVKIYDYVLISGRDIKISGSCSFHHYASVGGRNINISDSVKVSDYAVVLGEHIKLSGQSEIKEFSRVGDHSNVSGKAIVKGNTNIMQKTVTEETLKEAKAPKHLSGIKTLENERVKKYWVIYDSTYDEFYATIPGKNASTIEDRVEAWTPIINFNPNPEHITTKTVWFRTSETKSPAFEAVLEVLQDDVSLYKHGEQITQKMKDKKVHFHHIFHKSGKDPVHVSVQENDHKEQILTISQGEDEKNETFDDASKAVISANGVVSQLTQRGYVESIVPSTPAEIKFAKRKLSLISVEETITYKIGKK